MPPRPLRPKDERTTLEAADKFSEPQGSKRRAISSACIPCRKRKSKCDGALPACSTCTAVYRTECVYDEESDHRRKGALKRDIQSLRQRNDALDVIVTSLRNLPEDESILLLYSLRSEADLDALAFSLRTNVNLPQNFGHQTLEAEFTEQLSPVPSSSRGGNSGFSVSREDSLEDNQLYSGAASPAETSNVWIRTSHDVELIDHLFDLYFGWVHPFYQFFSREHFLHDMSQGRTEYCSIVLVNALLSFACHYSEAHGARSDPSNYRTAGDEFFAEAERELGRLDKPSLTTVQALAIMAIREISHGRDTGGYQYAGRCARMALELGLHLSVMSTALRPTESEIRKLTFWSVFNLETFIAVMVGRPTQLPRAAADLQKPTLSDATEIHTWQRGDDADLSLIQGGEKQTHSILFFNMLTSLSELTSDMACDFYAPRERFTSRRLAIAYAKYQEWHKSLPDVFQLGNTALPHVIILHMNYYAFVLLLFRPYIKLDLQSANLFPRDTCTFCANQISELMNILRSMYGLRRVCLRVTNLLLTASTIHLLNVPAEQSVAHLSQAIHDLQAMSLNHYFAGRCVNIIQSLAARWNIALPEEVIASVAQDQFRPSSSKFFAASIPRNPSLTGVSSYSAYNVQDASFFQPAQSQPFFGDSMVGPDPNQVSNALWTPFPSQTMPIPPQNVVPIDSMQQILIEEQGSQWLLGSRPAQGSTVKSCVDRRQSPSSSNVQLGADFERWHWQ